MRSSSASTTRPWTPPTTPASYEQLRRFLHVWSLAVVAARQPGYYEELAAVRSGTSTTVSVTEAIPDWAGRVASVRGPVGSDPPRRIEQRALKQMHGLPGHDV